MEIYKIPTQTGDIHVRRPFNSSWFQECTPRGVLVLSAAPLIQGWSKEEVIARGGKLVEG